MSEHDHPVVTKDEDEEDPEAETYMMVKISEMIFLSGEPKVVFAWIDELYNRSLLVRD